MWKLTRKEQAILLAIFSILITGVGVKAYRASHLTFSQVTPAKL